MPLRKLAKLFSNTSKPPREDFTFEEWQSLSLDAKGAVFKTWDPYHPEIGKATRDAILEAFKLQYSDLSKQSLAVGYNYFGWWVGCIYVIVPKSSIRVPQEFASIFVNKGFIRKRIDKETVLVNFRYGGTKYKFKLPVRKKTNPPSF